MDQLSAHIGSLADVGYHEFAPPPGLHDLVESAWALDGPPAEVRVLPDGCMDLIAMNDRVVVAGPDTAASVTVRDAEPYVGLRFRPGILPRLIGIPAAEVRNGRVSLSDLRRLPSRTRSLTALTMALAAETPRDETAPWTLPQLRWVTGRLASGVTVSDLAQEIGWSSRTVQRQCTAVYGYGAAMLRRVLRFRHARRLLDSGLPFADVAARAGYADQSHLHREVRALAGVPLTNLRQDPSGENRSTQLPSGSATVA